MPNKLVKVVDHFRGYSLYSLFVATEEDWERIERWCEEKQTINFGEIAGKHSELTLVFSLDDFKILSEDEVFISKFLETVGSFGEDILGRMCERCSECGDDIEDDIDDELCKFCRETLDDEEDS